MQLPARALRTIRRHRLFARRARVLVAISGGPDSVALLHILRVLEQRGELTVAGLAHLHHQLRGEAADGDEEFCRTLAATSGLPVEVGTADVAAEARRTGRSIEDAARTARYRFLHEALDRLQADVIAVGHSEDDQAETFLLRLLRGSGARGLSGIRPRAGRVVRPLLEIGRADLRAYVAEHQLPFREDASNEDVRIPRNRVRHELLPSLRRFNPAVVPVLAAEAALAREDEEYLGAVAIEMARAIVSRTGEGAELDALALRSLPAALSTRIVREALETAFPGRFLTVGHIRGVVELCQGKHGTSISLPGGIATRRGERILVGAPPPAAFSNSFRFPLSIPGEVVLSGWSVSAEPGGPLHDLTRLSARGGAAVLATGPLRLPLAVRTRRPGDRFRPLGMSGRGRKLQDYLVDRKIARSERDQLPLVVDRDDRIVWVVGQSVAEDFRVTAPEQGVILLKARRLGGLG